ncbi:MAG: UDP-N-acetylmuramoyl-L-alanyl-D-glutamate--2,6-diaminopimelate ligase [Nitrospirae bacterium]|nr:UDP-N-acetylmuramoyl-L-alanyl-D-glutamate--2,6-diaminopimelate ligase [Nitrospirota bacterium]
MTLKRLIEDMETLNISADTDIDIRQINYDSRKVMPGDLFVALKGLNLDGHDFIPDAIKRGASTVICENKQSAIPFIQVPDTRSSLAFVSNNFYERPSERLSVIGITGTNGKTTTSYLIKSILEKSGKKTGLIGTINYVIGDRSFPAPHTTPEALEFQSLLFEMLKAGLSHTVSEVSSHALSLKRVDYTRFSVAVFTNLTRDHLDFHGTMKEYFEAKKRLFVELLDKNGTAVINIDDPYGKELIRHTKAKVITYGIQKAAELKAVDIENSVDGISFVIRHGESNFRVNSPMVGIPNVYNILSSTAVSLSMGIKWDVIKTAIKETGNVKGRFEKVSLGQDFLCVVDYAHTEDALRMLILTARDVTPKQRGRVITVFGCGGQRDRGKRPLMGSSATELSDIVYITSDNPRAEEPMEIIKDILSGITKENYHIVPDRSSAIRQAVMEAGTEDSVIIAGKGHEDYQETKGKRLPFSDRQEAEKAIREKMK